MELNLLALETSSSRCGVALLRAADGRLDVTVREHEGSQEHAERLLPMAGELLAEAGLAPGALHAVAFGQGPGGFTGLRVACGVARAWPGTGYPGAAGGFAFGGGRADRSRAGPGRAGGAGRPHE